MKTIICLIGALALLATSGCVVRERGGYYGGVEVETGHHWHHGDRDDHYNHWDGHQRDWRY